MSISIAKSQWNIIQYYTNSETMTNHSGRAVTGRLTIAIDQRMSTYICVYIFIHGRVSEWYCASTLYTDD